MGRASPAARGFGSSQASGAPPVPGVPPVALVAPPVVVVAPRLPLLVHTPVLDATVSATKTQRKRFDIVPSAAHDEDTRWTILSTTRKSEPGNSREENTAVYGCLRPSADVSKSVDIPHTTTPF